MQLTGNSVLITGATRGIGRAFAERYIAEGASVAIADIHPGVVETAGKIGAVAITLDVADEASIKAGVAEAVVALGRVDILINNAGLFAAAPIVDVTHNDYDRTFVVNVAGTLLMMQVVARHMIDRELPGKIINMASQAGQRGEPLVAVYCASKAAVISLTQSAGLNLIQHGINVSAISPGVVDGDHWDGVDAHFARLEGKAPGQKKAEVGADIPYGRVGRAEDLTGMAVYLASDEANYVVAQTYNVDGGQWMS